jgi:hypothetical protein
VTKKKLPRARGRLHQAPLALATDGTVLVNVARLVDRDDLDRVIEHARDQGGPIFVGVLVPTADMPGLLHDLDDAAAEIAAWVSVRRHRRGSRR